MSRSRQQLSPQEADLLREARGSLNLKITDRGPHSHPRFRDEGAGHSLCGRSCRGGILQTQVARKHGTCGMYLVSVCSWHRAP